MIATVSDPEGVGAGALFSPASNQRNMSTYFKLHYHIVFGTKHRVACLEKSWRQQLWEYMGGTVRALDGVPHGIGGFNDHVHMLIDLRPAHRIADIVRDVKRSSTDWIRDNPGLKNFQWQEG